MYGIDSTEYLQHCFVDIVYDPLLSVSSHMLPPLQPEAVVLSLFKSLLKLLLLTVLFYFFRDPRSGFAMEEANIYIYIAIRINATIGFKGGWIRNIAERSASVLFVCCLCEELAQWKNSYIPISFNV
jgi:hypothetical protein